MHRQTRWLPRQILIIAIDINYNLHVQLLRSKFTTFLQQGIFRGQLKYFYVGNC